MIPIGDDNSLRKTTPIVTYIFILLNVLFFFFELAGGEEFVKRWAFIPSQFLANPAANFITLITAMFMHSGWGHLIGNMLYLWIFGDNVEDRLGKFKYIFFYLVTGMIATFAQLYFNPTSTVPNLGASGAIAGVLGAYLVLFPNGKVNVMVGRSITQMSALVVIGFWFVIQFFSGISSETTTADVGGVAYMAHIGGFVGGVLLTFLFKSTEKRIS